MSNAYDNEIFERSVEGSSAFEIPFKTVSRYEVTDSNLGNYGAGQLKFNLNQLATSSSFIDWKKSHLVIPLTLSVTSGANNGVLGANQITHFLATLKNSYTSLIDSIVFSINNTEIVSKTGSLLNIPMHFKLMTSWDANDVQALGASVGFYPDSVESFRYDATRGELNNALYTGATGVAATAGVSTAAPVLTATATNTGRVVRHFKTITSLLDNVAATFFGNASRLNTSHKSYNDATAATTTMNNHIECVIPLRYIHDIFDNLPLMRGSAVQLLVNTHLPSQCVINVGANGTNASATSRSVSSPNSFLPFMVSEYDPTTQVGITAAAQSVTYRASIGNAFNSQTQLRLSLVEMNPEYEKKLVASPYKQVYYRDWYCFPNQSASIAPGSSVNAMLSVNIPKLRRLLIVPKIATNGTWAEFADVYQSPFSSAGCTTSPQLLTNLQVFVSGKPVYQSPTQYGWEQFLLELEGCNSVNGSIEDGIRAGLIDKQGYESCYGYVIVNLSRKESADDVIEKAIQISFTNNNAVAMSYSYFIEYERGWEFDIVSGRVKTP